MTPLGFILWVVVIAAAIVVVGLTVAIAWGMIVSVRRMGRKGQTEVYRGDQ